MALGPDVSAPRGIIPPSLVAKLARLGIGRSEDLLLHLPMRYEDRSRTVPFAELKSGEPALAEGVIDAAEVRLKPRRQWVVHLSDGGALHGLTLRFFSFYPAQVSAYKLGVRLRVFGDVRQGPHGLEMVHPICQLATENAPPEATLTPVYPSTAALAQSAWRTMIGRALTAEPTWRAETLPSALLDALQLPGFEAALALLHKPPNDAPQAALEARTHPAWRRIKFDELLAQQLALKDARIERERETAQPMLGDGRLRDALLAQLPFALTGAQARAVDEILANLNSDKPMQRLLQGDVGSGKTIVAALAALAVIEAGYQAAFMVPTEILAGQHFNKLRAWLEGLPVRVEWLTGSQTAKARRQVQAAVAAGEVHLLVGTHALFQDKVQVPRLGLAIIDEQHRFGVLQRVKLRERTQLNALAPHQLMMSATPIPRSLAMSYYADLDVSVINELPAGRQPIATRLVGQARRDEIIARIGSACAAGAQAYWVCPLIEESETLDLQTAEATFETLCAALPNAKVGLLHGRMKPEEKASTMAAFIAKQLDVLVATTVIEVGVDVPNASWMVIEHAERFGLAQLHQLRGRVGRGSAASTCVLLYGGPLSEAARARLKAIYEHSDGFEIAREDLRIRGPGELLGPRQSGVPGLRYADIELDQDLLEAARDFATACARDPNNGFSRAAHLDRWMPERGTFAKG